MTVSPISLPLVPPFIVQKTIFPGQQISLKADLTKVDLLTYFPANVMDTVTYDWTFQFFNGQCSNGCDSSTFDVTIGIDGGTPTSYPAVDCTSVFFFLKLILNIPKILVLLMGDYFLPFESTMI